MTAEEFQLWADRSEWDRRFELIDGEPVERPLEGERHGYGCWLVCRLLTNYLDRVGGYACMNNTGLVVARNPDTVLGPDVIAFRESRTISEMGNGFVKDVPSLVVEVLSELDEGRDDDRVERFLRFGVPLVWAVDTDRKVVRVYRTGGTCEEFRGVEAVLGGSELPGFGCRAEEFFQVNRS
jgi:Uma2 family endonuclease